MPAIYLHRNLYKKCLISAMSIVPDGLLQCFFSFILPRAHKSSLACKWGLGFHQKQSCSSVFFSALNWCFMAVLIGALTCEIAGRAPSREYKEKKGVRVGATSNIILLPRRKGGFHSLFFSPYPGERRINCRDLYFVWSANIFRCRINYL